MFAPKVPRTPTPTVSPRTDHLTRRKPIPPSTRADVQYLMRKSQVSSPIQASSRGRTGDGHSNIQAAADRGVAGPGGRLPFLDVIQRWFGHHDVSSVVAHTDKRAKAACDAMGATAFATGNHVAFGEAPSLHTAAHEAAHVVQQRAGVHLRGGVGEAGDVWERQADKVANLVTSGLSAAHVLDGEVGPNSGAEGGSPAVQRRANEPSEAETPEAEVGDPATRQADAPAQGDRDDAPTDAPAVTRMWPIDQSPLAAPGERILFNAALDDPSSADYQLEYTTTGGHFTSAAGPTSRTIAGLLSGNVDFFIPTPWIGAPAVQVVLRVRRISTNAVERTETWNFGLKTRYPSTIAQVEGTGERAMPGIYSYNIGPRLLVAPAPYYQHVTILELFGARSMSNLHVADILPAYRTAHNLTTDAAVRTHFLPAYSSNNGTFTVDANDQIFDGHSGHPNLSHVTSQLAAPKDLEFAMAQTYEAQPGTALGSYTITRILKTDGTWRIRKG